MVRLRVGAALLVTAGLLVGCTSRPSVRAAPQPRPWLNTAEPLEQRVSQLLAALTLKEKTSLMYGVKPPASSKPVGYVPWVPRLGVPPLVLSDGPVGLRDSGRAVNPRPATALPASVSLSASFDPTLARGYGSLLGAEALSRGVDVLYGPAMNIVRVPLGGRDFEYFSEDPLLTAAIAVPYVEGVQRQRVAAQVKHFALNNQENARHGASSNADERTMREIYLPAWRAAVQDGHAWSLMCANNPVNGTYSCQNDMLLRQVLDGEWRFDGMVGSDYAATHSAVASVRAGLDQSFTLRDWGAYYRDLPGLVAAGTLSTKDIDARVRRILRTMFRIGLFDGPRPQPKIDVAAHGRFARAAAEEGTVLLRNDARLLPLDATGLKNVAVIGPYASQAHPGGGGSSSVRPFYTVSPAAGIAARVGAGVQVRTDDGSDPARAAELARTADVAVVVVGDTAEEGSDRTSMDLPGDQNALISAVVGANPRSVVVLDTGAPVTMPWLSRVSSLVEAWYPGEEDGNALAAVLFGDVDASGRLPVTFPVSASQSPSMGKPRYPAGLNGYEYTEGLKVGYRGFDALGRVPLFPFGYGLSYTTFNFSALTVSPTSTDGTVPIRVTFTVTNSGTRAGIAIPQAYVGFPASAGEPPHQLAAFRRVPLARGASQRVTLTVPASALSYWNTPTHRATPANGRYSVSVGSSSRDLPLSASVSVSVR